MAESGQVSDMAEKKSKKIFYIIFSIVVSITLWVYVVYVENPMLEEPMAVQNIQIEFTGEELLRENSLVVSSYSARELTVYFNGRLRDGPKISRLEVRAVVDLTELLRYPNPTGTYSLNYELIYDDSGTDKLSVDKVSIPSVDVTVEHMITEEIEIKPVYTGSIADGYMAGALTLSRDTVSVAGTEAAVAKIVSAVATLSGDDLFRSKTDEVNVKLYDDSGAEIDLAEAGLTFVNDTGKVNITQNILMVKEVALTINTVDTPSVNKDNTSIDISPSSIRLSGDPEVLEGLNIINLGTVDMKSFYTSFEEEFQIKIPNNVNNLSGNTSAKVNITIMDSAIEIRRLSTVNIFFINAGPNDNVEVITAEVPVVIRGTAEAINLVTEGDIRIVADLSTVAGSKGTFEVPAKTYVDYFPQVDAVGEYKISVFIS